MSSEDKGDRGTAPKSEKADDNAPPKPDRAGDPKSRVVTMSAGLDERVIQRVLAKHQSAIKACYERELRKNPNLSGKVVVRWVVDLTGVVQGAQVTRSTLSNQAVMDCIIQRLSQVRFPKPKGGGQVTITYPFEFSPE